MMRKQRDYRTDEYVLRYNDPVFGETIKRVPCRPLEAFDFLSEHRERKEDARSLR